MVIPVGAAVTVTWQFAVNPVAVRTVTTVVPRFLGVTSTTFLETLTCTMDVSTAQAV